MADEKKKRKKRKPTVIEDYLLYVVLRVAALLVHMMDVNTSLPLVAAGG